MPAMRIRLTPLVLLAAIGLIEYLAPWRVAGRALTFALAALLTARFVAQSFRNLRAAARVWGVLRTRFLELGLTLAALALLASKATVWADLLGPDTSPTLDLVYRQYAVAFLVVAGLRIVVGEFPVRRVLHRLELQPAQTVAVGFVGAILAGTLALSLPLAVERIEEVSLLDALFTAASAVTVTGLIVYDPGTFHTPFGQVVLLALIQLGGIGTMAASASLVVLAGRRLRLRRSVALQESMDIDTLADVRAQLKTIVAFTLLAEGLGAAALYLAWRGRTGIEAPAFAAVFHAISAFCNAGFSTFATGLAGLRDDVTTNLVMMALIVVGGLGFPVLRVLGSAAGRVWSGRRVPLLTLHARMALLTSGILLAGGAAGVALFEWRAALAPLDWGRRALAAAFLSVTARTAGFNTVDTSLLGPATLWLLMVLMFVGGSPGSTAGGVKTTTVATAVATLWATLMGRSGVDAFRRTIPEEQVNKALALIGVAGATVVLAIIALLATQAGNPAALTFEAVSAFGTVGLSMGVTPTLDAWGKLVVIATMFVGRTGPLTLGFALAARARRRHIVYPPEKVMIG